MPVAFLLLGLAATVEPGPAQVHASFRQALEELSGHRLRARDVWRVSCQSGDEDSTQAYCTWQLKRGRDWKRYAARVNVEGGSVRLVDPPRSQR